MDSAMVGSAGVGVAVVFYLAIVVVTLVAWFRILSQAGYSGWWTLIALVPLVNFVMFLVFAFSTWPIHRQPFGYRPGPGYGAAPFGQPPPGYGPPPGGYPPPGAGPPPPPSPPPPYGGSGST